MDGVKFSALICCFISIVLLVTVLTSPDWVETTSHSGLWKTCNDTVCNPFGMQMKGYIHATRALLIIGLIIGIVAFIDLCASFSHAYFATGFLTKFTSKSSFFAGIAVMAALGTFTGGFFVSGAVVAPSLGWTYGLGWVPGPLFFITVLKLLAHNHSTTTARGLYTKVGTMQCVFVSKLISIATSLLGSTMMITAFFTDYWISRPTLWGPINEDPWCICIALECTFLERGWAYNIFVRGFLVVGAGFGASCGIAHIVLLVFTQKKWLVKNTVSSSIGSVVFTLIGMAVYTGEYASDVSATDLGWPFYLAWVSIAFFFTAALTSLCISLEVSED